MSVPKIVDYRSRVPRKVGEKFARRRRENIKGVVFHQALGNGSVDDIARYHISPQCHISPGKGCPSICYTYFVAGDGTIYWCNDLEDITWSQGGGSAPIPGTKGNTNYIGVCFQGDFSGEGHEGKQEPTPAQLASADALWHYLKGELSLSPDALYGHHDFGKPACPGFVLSKFIDDAKKRSVDVESLIPRDAGSWQALLVKLGYDIGPAGADGVWGGKSQAGLVKFQQDNGIPATGGWNDRSARALAEKVYAKMIAEEKAAPKSEKKKSKSTST